MSDKEQNNTESESVLTGEDVELSGDHFLEDVTSVGEVGPAPELPEEFEESAAQSVPEFGTAAAETDQVVEVADGEEVAAASEQVTTEFAAPEAPVGIPSAPARTDLPAFRTVGTPDVLGNRGEAVFSEADETMVSAPVPPVDTAVTRRSLAEPTRPLPKRSELPDTPFPQVDSETVLAGATVRPTVPSRAGARWLSAIVFLLLTPVVWYLFADAGARMFAAQASPWETGNLNLAALGEFLGGAALIILLGIVAAQSSLGLLLGGLLFTIVGLPFIVVPGFTADFVNRTVLDGLNGLGTFGLNVHYHLITTGATGILTAVGITMIVSSWVLSRVRRKGREEEALRAEVAVVNPDGLGARWARKASRG